MTVTADTPSTPATAFSTWAWHAAHVMPPTSNLSCAIGASRSILLNGSIPLPLGGRVSKLRNTTKRFQPTETVTNPNVCALDDALMAVLPLESALARARWPSEHPFGRPNGPTAIQIAKTIAHTIGFVTESQSRSLTLPDHVAFSRAKTAKIRSQTVCCKNHQRSVRCGRPRTPLPWPGGRPKRTNTGSKARPDGVGAQDGGGFAPTKLPPSHKPAPANLPLFCKFGPANAREPPPTERRRSADAPRARRGRCRTR